MFCKKCGASNRPDALYCHACGNLDLTPEPPARRTGGPGAIWNPNAAANWSLVFTPAFGSYLQMRNWDALQEPAKARAARGWFVASLCVLFGNLFIGMLLGDAAKADSVTRLMLFVFLLAWYFASGRAQGKYVKAKFGKNYARRPWGRALLFAVVGVVAYFVIAIAVGILVGLATKLFH
ncbi:MAG: zinc ribbon domain-containing protein [Pseudomonadota bacterium]